MSTTQTLREPKRKRSRSNAISQDVANAEPETAQEEYRRWRLAAAERQEREGLASEPPLTMEEIVAIIKEVRAERYAEKQKNSTCH